LTLQKLVASSYDRRFHLWKDKLVMPLDIAMKNAQLKTLTNVNYTNYLLCFRAVTIATVSAIFRNPIHSALYLVICFSQLQDIIILNSQFLAICSHHCLLWSDYDLFLFTIMLMNLNKENEVINPELLD
jgi:NADH:ubiquinone oxidoreductase subunit 6 (subunit J)